MILPDLLQIRTAMVNFHVLRDETGLYLLDAGFVGGVRALRRELRKAGWDGLPIHGIILTHGHLDHILNVGTLAKETGAWIAAPRLDEAHYAGRPVYHGLSRVTGVMEGIGRPLLGFRAFVPDRWIEDGELPDVWHGLRAVHLPGHTAGHTGFYSEHHKLLFCADLFASHGKSGHLPPAIFNSRPEMIPGSISKALSLDLEGILPNHADKSSPAVHLDRLRRLAARLASQDRA
jgi:glyoxylase-like metal-dependent hydrolase (beta-lactamase superfamily II)